MKTVRNSHTHTKILKKTPTKRKKLLAPLSEFYKVVHYGINTQNQPHVDTLTMNIQQPILKNQYHL